MKIPMDIEVGSFMQTELGKERGYITIKIQDAEIDKNGYTDVMLSKEDVKNLEILFATPQPATEG